MHTSAALRVPSHHPQLEHFMPLYSLLYFALLSSHFQVKPTHKVVFPHLPFSGQSLAMPVVFINISSMFGSLAQAVIRVVAGVTVLCVVFFRARVASSASSSHLHRLHHASCRPGPACSSPSSSLPRVCAGHRDCQCVGRRPGPDRPARRTSPRAVACAMLAWSYSSSCTIALALCQCIGNASGSVSLRFFLSAESPNRSLYCLLLSTNLLTRCKSNFRGSFLQML
jgi:hypothetical protein